jgi:hypothetical protein
LRYFIHAVDGQTYGPSDMDTINQWIVEGRVVPTTLLQPENSTIRVAASTIDGLVWGANQTFDAYTPQKINTGLPELKGSWVCFAASLILCCLPQGFHLVAGIVGVVLATIAYRKGHQIALLVLILNLVLLLFLVLARFGMNSAYDPQELLKRVKSFQRNID